MYKKFLNFTTPTNEENYKTYRNKLHHSIGLAKFLYYEGKLESLKRNAKGTWKILNQIINRNHKSNKLPSTFTNNNLEISDPNLIANSEMLKLPDWFKANKLALNIQNSNYILFKPRQKRDELTLSIEMDGFKINQVKEVNFLGVILDETLSWKPHISQVASSLQVCGRYS